jgi:hypothetical protein
MGQKHKKIRMGQKHNKSEWDKNTKNQNGQNTKNQNRAKHKKSELEYGKNITFQWEGN